MTVAHEPALRLDLDGGFRAWRAHGLPVDAESHLH
jgi:rhodanese-related sulfurtransferase